VIPTLAPRALHLLGGVHSSREPGDFNIPSQQMCDLRDSRAKG